MKYKDLGAEGRRLCNTVKLFINVQDRDYKSHGLLMSGENTMKTKETFIV